MGPEEGRVVIGVLGIGEFQDRNKIPIIETRARDT